MERFVSVGANSFLQELTSIGKGDKMVYHISSVIRQSFFLPKQSQKSRSVLLDRSRSLGLFLKGKTRIIAKFHRTD